MAAVLYRVVLVFFCLATLLLSVMALIGSYQNADWLTQTYLIDFQLTELDLKAIFNKIDKRDFVGPNRLNAANMNKPSVTMVSFEPSSVTRVQRDVIGSLITEANGQVKTLGAAATEALAQGNTEQLGAIAAQATEALILAAGLLNDAGIHNVDDAIEAITKSMTYRDLGLADVYLVSYWGYCRGYSKANTTKDKSQNEKIPFDNSNSNFTWCSPPKAGFKFDPLDVIKNEINNIIDGNVQGGLVGMVPDLSADEKNYLKVLVDNLDYDILNLPNDLEKNLSMLHTATVASMALLFVVVVFAFLEMVLQILGMCCDPQACWSSCLNGTFQFLLFLLSIVSSGLTTGLYIFVRGKVNDVTGEFGVHSYLSINFYAFMWSASVSTLLLLVFSLLGHCCGCFGGRTRYRSLPPHEMEKY